MSRVEIETEAFGSAKAMTSSTVLTTTTTTTTSSAPTPTAHQTTQKTQTNETKESQSRVTLSPSDILRLCFLNSSYCDLSQNEVVVSNGETTTTLTTTPSTSTTAKLESDRTTESVLLLARQKDIKDLIRKCFLTGECGDAGHSGSVDQRNSSVVTTTTESDSSSSSATPSSRDSELRRQVKARARACLFEGKCNK